MTSDRAPQLLSHPNLLAPAVEIGASVWPIAARYMDSGCSIDAAACTDETDLITSLAKVRAAREAIAAALGVAEELRDGGQRELTTA